MTIFNKQKFVITFGISAILLYVSFAANAAYSSTYKLNRLTDIYTSIINYLKLEQTPDQISRNSEKIILKNIEKSIINKK